MALLFVDSFDHYTSFASLTNKWDSFVSTATIVAGAGRRGTRALRLGAGHYINKSVPLNSPTITIGGALTYATFSNNNLFYFGGSDLGFDQVHCSFYINAGSGISAWRGRQYVLLGSSTNGILAPGAYKYIEAQVFVSATVGTVTVKVDGATVLALTNVNTKGDPTQPGIMYVGVGGAGGTNSWDDVYITDATGANNTGFLGDSRVDLVLPNGEGNYLQWTPTGGGTHYTQIDDVPNQIATNVLDSTVGNIDCYTMQDISAIGSTIFGAQEVFWGHKSDAGARSVEPFCRSNGTDSALTALPIGTGDSFYRGIYELNPDTATAWTETTFNAAEFGVKTA